MESYATVGELVAALQKMPQDAVPIAVVRGEAGIINVCYPKEVYGAVELAYRRENG